MTPKKVYELTDVTDKDLEMLEMAKSRSVFAAPLDDFLKSGKKEDLPHEAVRIQLSGHLLQDPQATDPRSDASRKLLPHQHLEEVSPKKLTVYSPRSPYYTDPI